MKMYFFLGGMPEVIADYIEHKDINASRQIQNDILNAYQRDFSKYSNASQALKVAEIWQSIPFQLAKENKKFTYKDVKKNSRASTYEQSIDWHFLEYQEHLGVHEAVKDLNHLYSGETALHQLDHEPGGFEWITHDDAENSIFAFYLKYCKINEKKYSNARNKKNKSGKRGRDSWYVIAKLVRRPTSSSR